MTRYTFGEIAENIKEKRKPVKEDKDTYIGLEHLDHGSLCVTRWGSEAELKGEKLCAKKGDVLFGRRNTYLKRVAIAPFDCLFSAHGLILRPKEEVITKEYFPFFLSSDYFMNEAIRISVGSLSPTVNWSDLKELEFDLPPLEEQKRLADILWAAEDLKQKLEGAENKLQIFKIAYSRSLHEKYQSQILNIKDFAQTFEGATPKTNMPEYWEEGTIPWLSSGEIHKKSIWNTDKKITQLGFNKTSTHMIPCNSVLIALAGQGITRGTVAMNKIELCSNQSIAAIIPDERVISEFLYYNLDARYNELRAMSNDDKGRGGLNLKIIGGIQVPVPDISIQKKCVELMEQIDYLLVKLRQEEKQTLQLQKIILNNIKCPSDTQ